MARWCRGCGRPLEEPYHEVLRGEIKRPSGIVLKDQVIKQPRIVNRGRGRINVQKVRIYGCKVRLVARSPVSGKVIPTDHPQRIKELQTAFAHPGAIREESEL